MVEGIGKDLGKLIGYFILIAVGIGVFIGAVAIFILTANNEMTSHEKIEPEIRLTVTEGNKIDTIYVYKPIKK